MSLSAFWSLLIVAVLPTASTRSHHPDAVEIFTCDFGRQWDVNYDGWPDKWQRHFGPKLPHYVGARIEDDLTAVSGRCLTVKVDGGGAHLESPLVGVSDKFSYKVEASLRLKGLDHSRVRIRVEFCDDEKTLLQTETSPWRTGASDWSLVQIGPVNPSNDAIRLARIVLEIEQGASVDLEGEASIDEIWMARMPKMTVYTNSPFNVYADISDIKVTCDLSGILDSDPEILFELLDASSQRIEGNRVQLDGQLITEVRSKASDFLDAEANRRAAYAGSTAWQPPIKKPGFYKVRVTMASWKEDEITIAVVPPLDRPEKGEFGWSLSGVDAPMTCDELTKLLPRVAVNWVKLPMWYSETEPQRGDQFVMFAEKLAAKDIEVVGVIDRPPATTELATRLSRDVAIADTLSMEESAWLPLLDPVLTRLSLRVRWWQLGADRDTSFASLGQVERELQKLRDKLFRFGQEVNLGISWKWTQGFAESTPAAWEFQQFVGTPTLTGQELGEYLDLPPRGDVRRWALVEPLSRREYDLETRACDLVEQMLAAKIHGADAIFAFNPFDDERGLMTSRGTPGELLLPWRTTSSLLSAAKYLGSIPLPQRSHNRIFETAQGDVVMVVWADAPTREAIFLGDDVRVLDVWGRDDPPLREGDRQVIEVETLPKFVRGLEPRVARWRMAAKFASRNVPSVFGKPHPNQLHLQNTFGQGVGGHVELFGPKGWQLMPAKIDFKLAADEVLARPFESQLPFDASSGRAPIRADFVVDAERQYRFSMFLDLNVGDDQIALETNTRLEQDGSLIVEQRMTNHSSSQVDFKCLLYAPGRRRQRTQVLRLGGNPDVKIYRYPEGAQLLGSELWLRAEEIDGFRVINHRFVVEQ
jgi:hypothetical protein